MVRPKLSETDLQNALYAYLSSQKKTRVFPNVKLPQGEADLLLLETDGRLTEYEIKTTKADYLRDFQAKLPKHQHYAKKRPAKGLLVPHYFCFVLGFSPASIEDLPPHAGIMELKGQRLHLRKAPPLLHQAPLPQNLEYRLLVGNLYKYWRLRLGQ